eukprot:5860415-Pyramimonas_sp.AAC.1
MPPEARSFDSEHPRAWEELYEVPGGDQVDGSPPVPVRFENQSVAAIFLRKDSRDLSVDFSHLARNYLYSSSDLKRC